MKFRARTGIRHFSKRGVLALALGALPLPFANAANYYWDGNPGTDPIDTASQGGSGTWSTAVANWDNAANHVVWSTGNTAYFGGTAGTVTLGTAITAAGVNFTTGGYSIATGANTLTLAGPIVTANASGTNSITGTLAASAGQTWSVASGGTLQFDANFTSGASSYTFQLNSAGTTNITGSFSVAGKSTLSSGATGGIINFSGTESFQSASTDYSGIANVTVNNIAGTATFSPGTGNSFYVGNSGDALKPSVLNVIGGTVLITSDTRIFIGDGFSGVVTTAGDGTLTVGGGSGTGIFTTGTTTNVTAITLGNNVSTGTINLLANGIFSTNRNITAGATNKGTFNFDGGIFRATGISFSTSTSLVAIVKEGGAIIDAQSFAVTLNSSFSHGGAASTDGGITINGTTAVSSVTLSGVLSHTGGLVFNTAGGTLSGNNTYTGVTQINKFVDGKTSGNILGATGAGNGTSINAGGTLRFRDTPNATIPEAIVFNGGGFRTYNSGGTTTLSGQLTLAANTLIDIQPEVQASTTVILSGGIAETGGPRNLTIIRSDAAAAASNDVVNITGVSSYTGTTTVQDALNIASSSFSLKLSGGDDRLSTATVLTLSASGGASSRARLILGDATTGAIRQTLSGLLASGAGTQAVVGGSAAVSTLALNIASGTNSYSGALGGSGTNENSLALTKSGNGTLALAGATTFTGATEVSGGTLALSGAANLASSASVTVASGAALDVTAFATTTFGGGSIAQTLGGNGTITATGKTVAIGGKGTLAPGGSPGATLTVSGAVSMGSGSMFAWDLDSPTAGAGPTNQGTYDHLAATSLGGSGSIFQVLLDAGDSFSDPFWDTAKSWDNIFSATSGSPDLAAIFSGGFGGAAASDGTVAGQGQFAFTSSSLTWSAVPEPTGAASGLLVVAGLLRRRRKTGI